MLWAGSEAHLYLAPQLAWLSFPSAGVDPNEESQREAVERIEAPTWEHVLEAACRLLVRRPRQRRRVKVWLSGAFARPFVLPPTLGLRSRHECQLLAEAQAVDETGLDWPCAVWLDSWRAGQPCLAVAAAREVVDAACKMTKSAGLRLCGIEPAWNGILSQRILDKEAIAPAGLFAIREPDALTMMSIKDGLIVKAQTMSPPPYRLEAQLLRQAMKWEMPDTKCSSLVVSGFAQPKYLANVDSLHSHYKAKPMLFDGDWQETS